MVDFCFATFCFGDVYYTQTNRLIESFISKNINFIKIFVITDQPDKIRGEDFVYVKHINEYNEKYNSYEKNYYDFDFSVKRYSLKFALDNGFEKIALVDCDIVLTDFYSEDEINNSFLKNCITGPICYELDSCPKSSMLGERLKYYAKIFQSDISEETIKNSCMPEDCILFFNVEKKTFEKFLDCWDYCIKTKYEHNLINIPAGNIDEICFSAYKYGISTRNLACDSLIAIHDKWYY